MSAKEENLRRAFVFGNAAVDEVFQVRDLPVAGESVLGTTASMGLGGKGANQAIALARTGMPTTLLSAVGSDWYGREITKALSCEPLETELFERMDIPSDRSIVFAQEHGDNVIVTTNACARSISANECMSLLEHCRAGDAVLLQGNLRTDVTATVCQEARRRDAFLVLNPSPFDTAFHDLLNLTDALFVNESEAFSLTGLSRQEALAALLRAGPRQIVLTLGSEGSLLASKSEVIHVPAIKAEVFDVTGAGDCFEGVAVGSSLRRGNRIDEAAIIHATKAAAQTIGALGASQAFPNKKVIESLVQNSDAV